MLDNLIYRGKRVGQGGKIFTVYKIKTMYNNSEPYTSKVNGHDDLVCGKLLNDRSVIKNRKWLRSCFLDELPQLFNILKGDMTIFGQRPICPDEFALFPEQLRQKYIKFKPGLMAPLYLKKVKNFQQILETHEEYFNRKIEGGFLSDSKYFFRIIANIVLGNIRGI